MPYSKQYTYKARPVTFKRVNYRSVLEARWAVFMSELELDFIYEPRGYRLKTGYHIPDFWLPQYKLWVQVKGPIPTKHDVTELTELVRVTKANSGQVWRRVPSHLDWQHKWLFVAVGPSTVSITNDYPAVSVTDALKRAKHIKL